MEENPPNESIIYPEKYKRLINFQGGLMLASLTGVSILCGFGVTIAMAKKQDPSAFSKGMMPLHGTLESGGSLALKALGRGTLYSVTGVGLLSFLVWKLMGISNMKEFRSKMQSLMPKIPKKESSGRSDFKTIRELFEYLIDEDNRKR